MVNKQAVVPSSTATAPPPFTPEQLHLLTVILDTVFHAEPASVEQKENAAACPLSSYDFSSLPDFTLDDFVAHLVGTVPAAALEKLRVGLGFLSSRPITFALTGHYTTFVEMAASERQRILGGWACSSLALKRSLFSAFVRLPISAIYSNSRLVQGLIAYPLPDQLPDSAHLDIFETDVVIIGSGAGGAVVASLVAKAGYKTLVIEKGRWVPTEEITGSLHGFNDMLEGNGQISTSDGNLILLLGATFGGGTTINWSASLAPPFHVRRAWAEEHGLPYFATNGFADDIEAVTTRMGVSTTAIVHSKANQLFQNGRP
ncbi:hypothetical protein PCASD_14485 [Puccinia coronata f. sp. avenae]|uniref:Glucose-methanol-choline oxidoreductase N-terminal domain-containing protein n=1 Tax=Puccinia coronata f. sp. avenae TaxID=200324 RepID=A0A2N5U8I0_9BASI|nr:hypothetical protein PCASD_14485 [Puccinia coronata f. sp. avenae]